MMTDRVVILLAAALIVMASAMNVFACINQNRATDKINSMFCVEAIQPSTSVPSEDRH